MSFAIFISQSKAESIVNRCNIPHRTESRRDVLAAVLGENTARLVAEGRAQLRVLGGSTGAQSGTNSNTRDGRKCG